MEISCSSQSSEDQLPLEDSGVDSEEDFRLWSTGLGAASATLGGSEQQQQQQQQVGPGKPKLDLKFLEDILLADIHTALARLQDTLKRVDIGTLTRYNASLDPSNKLYLLRLISSLLAKLKVPEDAIAKPSEIEARFHSGPRRRKNERHTISVSAEEIARAKRWFDEKSVSSNESSPRIDLEKDSETERIVEGAPSTCTELESVTGHTPLEKPGIETQIIYDKGAFNDKCMKDAINQQQSLQHKNNRDSQKECNNAYDPLERVLTAPRRFDGLCKDDSAVDDFHDRSLSFYQQHSTAPTRHNKFTAKKSKIKRANTIDIPNYLKFKSESPDQIQNGCFALRRPIDVGDRIINGHQKVVPSFEPKTENDRKFLALINKNIDTNTNNSGTPFKTFSYRQNSIAADKNWNNRFSNIKTNFDRTHENEEHSQRKPGKLDLRKKFENIRDDSLEREGVVVGSLRLPYSLSKQNQNGFTHAPTSPFQKIERSSPKMESVQPFMKPGYMPKNNNMLQAKLKMFDQEVPKLNIQNDVEPSSRTKHKFGKPPENSFSAPQPANKSIQQEKVPLQTVENGHPNYYSFCKQFAPFASGRSDLLDGKSNVNSAKSKLLVNLNKDLDKPQVKNENPKTHQESKSFLPNLDIDDNRHDFSKQYSYHKPHDNYPANVYENSVNEHSVQNYTALEKKPEPRQPRGNFQAIDQENNCIKPVKPPRRFETSTQNVAVQTTQRSTDRRPSEPELINSLLDSSRGYPVPQPRKLRNNVSVQTTSPSIISPMQRTSQSYTQTSTSPSIVSPIPHSQQSYSHQPPSSVIKSTPNYSTYQHTPADEIPRSYYDSNYVHDTNHHQPDNYSYSSIPYHHQPRENYPSVNTLVNTLPLDHSAEQQHANISQKLYNEFSRLPENPASREFSIQDYIKNDNSVYPIPESTPYKDITSNDDEKNTFKPTIGTYEEKRLPDLDEENIQNQDISSDGVVTRYTCAIATVSSMPEDTKPSSEIQPTVPPRPYEPVVPRIKEAQPRHFAKTTSIPVPAERKVMPDVSLDEIQRHNMLQQSLIRRMQNEQQFSEKIPLRRFSQEISRNENRSPTSPSFNSANFPGRVCALKALSESHKTQDKINLFEEKKLDNKQLFRPLNVPPKVNIVNPTSTICKERSPIRSHSPIDSSDEYLMSCANKPSRNIVLSKSESWHQLAIAKGAGVLQLPQPSSGTQLKPPKPKSPSSLRLSKQFEASLASDNARKMEEKIQRYFQGSAANSQAEETKQTSKRETKNKRNLPSKKSLNNLMRSHTMPHLYDEKLLDENVDVDQAFDSIFKEATRSDNRH